MAIYCHNKNNAYLCIRNKNNLNTTTMTKKIFKTRKAAEQWANEFHANGEWRNLPEGYEVDFMDGNEILCISGTCPAAEIIENGETVAIIAWSEEGDDLYEIKVNGEVVATSDNVFDAREIARDIDTVTYDEESDTETENDIKLLCNGEEIDF